MPKTFGSNQDFSFSLRNVPMGQQAPAAGGYAASRPAMSPPPQTAPMTGMQGVDLQIKPFNNWLNSESPWAQTDPKSRFPLRQAQKMYQQYLQRKNYERQATMDMMRMQDRRTGTPYQRGMMDLRREEAGATAKHRTDTAAESKRRFGVTSGLATDKFDFDKQKTATAEKDRRDRLDGYLKIADTYPNRVDPRVRYAIQEATRIDRKYGEHQTDQSKWDPKDLQRYTEALRIIEEGLDFSSESPRDERPWPMPKPGPGTPMEIDLPPTQPTAEAPQIRQTTTQPAPTAPQTRRATTQPAGKTRRIRRLKDGWEGDVTEAQIRSNKLVQGVDFEYID